MTLIAESFTMTNMKNLESERREIVIKLARISLLPTSRQLELA